MQSKGSNNRLSGMVFRFEAQGKSILIFGIEIIMAGCREQGLCSERELDRITGQGQSAISVDDTLKIIACREQRKKLSALEMELVATRQEGFVSKHLPETKNPPKKRPLVVIGILTSFGRKNNREAIRKAWMTTGAALTKMEEQKGIIVQFVFRRSANSGDSLDRDIDSEKKQTNDFSILELQDRIGFKTQEDHVEAPEELPKKTKLFSALAAEKWDADFYAKVNDDVYVNIGTYSIIWSNY